MLQSTSMKADDDWQTLHVRVAVWRKLRLLAVQRDKTLGELIAELVERETAEADLEKAEAV